MKLILVCLVLGLVHPAFAYLRSRQYQTAPDGSLVDSFLRWEHSPETRIHAYSGTLSNSSKLEFERVLSIARQSVQAWMGPQGLLQPSLFTPQLLLNQPQPIAYNCTQLPLNFGGDRINNIVFSSKQGKGCSSDIATDPGVIALTTVLSDSRGIIFEADIQLNDIHFTFVENEASDLQGSRVNLSDALTHEFGHFWGLDHSSAEGATMSSRNRVGMQTLSSDDQMGLYALYPPQPSPGLVSLKGSVTNPEGEGLFGVAINFLNARTLELVSVEMSDLNGDFEACYLPEATYVAFASSFQPAQDIAEYYSGVGADLRTPRRESGLCVNPGCRLLNQSFSVSWFADENSKHSARQLHPLRFRPRTLGAEYLNLSSRVEASATATFQSSLELDEVVAGRFLALGDEHVYEFRAPEDLKELRVRSASKSLNSKTTLSLVPDSRLRCTSLYLRGERGLNCENLKGGEVYVFKVQAQTQTQAEPSSAWAELLSGASYNYALSVYSADSDESGSDLEVRELATYSRASVVFKNLPNCKNPATVVEPPPEANAAPDAKACCGMIREQSGGPKGPPSFLLSLLFNPILWFAIYWSYKRRWLYKRNPSSL